MKETKRVGEKSLRYTGTPAGAVQWTNELISRFGPDAKLPDVCRALLKEQDSNNDAG